jgi:hypothetical protein
MKCYIFRSGFDNVADPEWATDCEWADIVEMLSTHRPTENKDEQGFILGSFETDPELADPAIDNRGKDNEKIKWGTVGRLSANLRLQHAACLDFDGGTTLEEVATLLVDMNVTHCGYTSFNHQNPDKGSVDKFRVVLPFSTPCPKDEWELRRHNIIEMFPALDHSTVASARIFYAPAHPPTPEAAARAFAWAHNGVMLDWRDLPAKEALPPPKPIDRTNLVKDGHGKVVWETFDAVSFMRDQGLYKSRVSNNKHNVICPNYFSHTGQNQSGTVLYQDGQGFPSFYCSHGHCGSFKFYDHFKQTLGKGWMANYCERTPEINLEEDLKKRRALLRSYK